MAYDRQQIYEKAKEEAENKKLIWIEEVVSYLPCSKATFYEYFPAESDELDAIKGILEDNKIKIKSALRKKWFDSKSSTLQIALMKIVANDEEAHRLNGTKHENKLSGEVKTNVEVSKPVSIIVTGLPKSLNGSTGDTSN